MRTDHGYARYSSKENPCRCEICRAAKAAYVAGQRSTRVGLPFGDPRHGTRSGFDNHRCRCQKCVDAKRTSSRVYYAGRVS